MAKLQRSTAFASASVSRQLVGSWCSWPALKPWRCVRAWRRRMLLRERADSQRCAAQPRRDAPPAASPSSAWAPVRAFERA
jgi:hypothetical protein